MTVDPQNSAFYWANHFLREVQAQGVRHVVISPGSRSTPLTMAAALHPGLQTHVVLDERSAGFLALGIGKESGHPAALICTSGTAAANYYPAVIEARQSGIPMLILTADRPPLLRDTGANQAIDQLKLFGDYPVLFHEAGEPVLRQGDLNRLRTLASQAVAAAQNRGGAAHINFPFRKPLEPAPDFARKIAEENRALDQQHGIPNLSPPGRVPPAEEVLELMKKAARPVVIAGPAERPKRTQSAAQVAEMLQAPLLTEFPEEESLNIISGFSGYLRNAPLRSELAADLIIRFGRQPVSKAMQLYLEDCAGCPQVHFTHHEVWQDATHTLTHRQPLNGNRLELPPFKGSADPSWLERWRQTARAFGEFRERRLVQEKSLTDAHISSKLSGQIPPGWRLFLSNSFPVRDWMLFGNGSPHPTHVTRGASGIDGILSSAIGATIAGNRPGVLIAGDLAALHDSNALLSSKLLEHPLVVIVVNNGGGNIFRMLPVAEHEEIYRDYFETPQQAGFDNLARAHLVHYRKIGSLSDWRELNLEQFRAPGIHLVECITDSDASMDIRQDLWNYSGGSDEG